MNNILSLSILINAKHRYASEDNLDFYRLYCEPAGFLLAFSGMSVSKDDYERYSNQIGQSIYILHIGEQNHLVHSEELLMD